MLRPPKNVKTPKKCQDPKKFYEIIFDKVLGRPMTNLKPQNPVYGQARNY